MSESMTDAEPKLWADADPRQKSYVVQILHWFYYRPTRLKASWKQEEVLPGNCCPLLMFFHNAYSCARSSVGLRQAAVASTQQFGRSENWQSA